MHSSKASEIVQETAAPDHVDVDAPARLHLGFIDLGGVAGNRGGGGRRFGSVGLAIDGVGVRLRALRLASGEPSVMKGPGAARVERAVDLVRRAFALDGGVRIDAVRIEIAGAIPEHVGLGSGTQAALAAGAALSDLFGLGLAPRALAALLERGARSGIGVGAFERGGFVVDGGRLEGQHEPPPIVSRLDFPPDWRVVLIFDRGERGLHGEPERAAFRALPPFPAAAAGHLAHLVLMQMLPGLCEQRLDEFGAAIAELQDTIGDHFAPVQGGRFASPRVARALGLLRAAGIAASGQSSWGPTGFAIVAGDAQARDVVDRLARDLPAAIGCELTSQVVRGRNHGAVRTAVLSMDRGIAPVTAI